MAINQLSLIIPAYQEEDSVARVVNDARKVLADQLKDFEIIVVDDGSEDATSSRALAAGAKVIRHPANLGYGNSLKTGISHATYGHVAICDADCSYDPGELKKLIPYAGDFDMVVGTRTGSEFLGTGFKRIARWLQLRLVRFTTGTPIPDANSGMRIFKKEKLLDYFESICGGFSFTTSITLAMLSTHRTIKYIPISYNPRIGKSHVRFIRDSLASLQIITQVMLKYNPIKAFIATMIFPMTLGIISLIGAFAAFYLDNRLWVWLAVLTLILSILLIILLFGMGMLAYATQHRPKEVTFESRGEVMLPDNAGMDPKTSEEHS